MEENKTIYLVVTTYSFSSDVELKTFRTEKEAGEYVRSGLQEERRIAVEENEIPEEEIEIEYDASSASLILYSMDADGRIEKETMTWTIKEMFKNELIPE